MCILCKWVSREGALDETGDDQMWRAATDSDEYMIIDLGSNNFFVTCLRTVCAVIGGPDTTLG